MAYFSTSLRYYFQLLLYSLLGVGIITTVLGFAGIFVLPLSLALFFPLLILGALLFSIKLRFAYLSVREKFITVLLTIWWLLHSLHVFVPETGFDAVWYHLPVAQGVMEHQGFYIDHQLYQSFNPLFSDSIFYLGYMMLGELGAKIVAYAFGVSLIIAVYQLSRSVLNREESLVVALIVSGFQVISWQSSSFYIDTAKAFWEVSAVWVLLSNEKNPGIKSGLIFGASLASKVFSLLLLPVIGVITYITSGKKAAVSFALAAVLVALPYYYFSYQATDNPLYSAFHHVDKLNSIGGEEKPLNYLLSRTFGLVLLPIEVIKTREYTTPLLVLFFPLLLVYRKMISKDKKLLSLTIFSIFQLLIWWYVPPLSVRYAVSGFITTTIVTVFLVLKFWESKKFSKNTLIWTLIVVGVLYMPVRIVVGLRSAEYLLGTQTKVEYLEQFLDGNIDEVLKKWHKLD